MKVKDLIKHLDGANPEAEVVVNGQAVICQGIVPGYYDGVYAEALTEEDGTVFGIKWCRRGSKFVLSVIDDESLLFDNHKFKIEWDESDPFFSKEYISKARLRYKAIKWEGSKISIKYGNMTRWFPLDAYDYAKNPYGKHLPKEYR